MAYWYHQGTITVTQDSTTVSGTGTAFVENLRVGDGLLAPDGRLYLIQNIASDAELAIARGYVGETAADSADWWGVPVQGYNRDLADRVQQLVTEAGAALETVDDVQSALDQLAQTVGDLDAEAVGADPEGAATGAVEAHEQATDPHQQYLNEQRGDDRYARLSGAADANFAAMPQVAGADIVEAGSNANGRWVRLSAGVQFCTARLQLTYAPGGWTVNTPWTYPAEFNEAPVVSFTAIFQDNNQFTPGDANLSMYSIRNINGGVSSLLAITRAVGSNAFESGDYIEVYAIAVGTWS